MCREEENIVDRKTLERAEKKEVGKARPEESFWTRRFISRASICDDIENLDPSKLVRQLCETKMDDPGKYGKDTCYKLLG
jgi:uncharacterized protein YlaI